MHNPTRLKIQIRKQFKIKKLDLTFSTLRTYFVIVTGLNNRKADKKKKTKF